MYLPNGEGAIVPIEKLRDYCLNKDHIEGKHKAKVFASALGMTADDAEDLQQLLLTAAKTREAELGMKNAYGQRYVLDFTIPGPFGPVAVRSTWIVRTTEKVPRLVTCYVN